MRGTLGYSKSSCFTGDSVRAIETARLAFVQAGYNIVHTSDTKVTARHEGGFVRSISGNTLYGASPITVAVSADGLVIEARFDGIEKAKRFILRLLIGLAGALGLGLGIPFMCIFSERWPVFLGVSLGVGIPLIQLPIHYVVWPLIMRKRAGQALDTLAHNITMLSSENYAGGRQASGAWT